MTFADELKAWVKQTHDNVWATRDGQVVPSPGDIKAGTDAVRFKSATVLYADLADSTGLVKGWKDWFAAEIYKNYLYCAARIIAKTGGTITAYDGDRVMAVYLGDSKNTNAADAALKINWAVTKILKPAIKAKYPDNKYVLRHKVGVDTSSLFVANIGMRGANDLVWVGNAANNAAKMATLNSGYETYITGRIYDHMNKTSKFGGEPERNMWTNLGTSELGYQIYGSTWWRSA